MRYRVPVVVRGHIIVIAGSPAEAGREVNGYEGWRLCNRMEVEKILYGEEHEIVEVPKEEKDGKQFSPSTPPQGQPAQEGK